MEKSYHEVQRQLTYIVHVKARVNAPHGSGWRGLGHLYAPLAACYGHFSSGNNGQARQMRFHQACRIVRQGVGARFYICAFVDSLDDGVSSFLREVKVSINILSGGNHHLGKRATREFKLEHCALAGRCCHCFFSPVSGELFALRHPRSPDEKTMAFRASGVDAQPAFRGRGCEGCRGIPATS